MLLKLHLAQLKKDHFEEKLVKLKKTDRIKNNLGSFFSSETGPESNNILHFSFHLGGLK